MIERWRGVGGMDLVATEKELAVSEHSSLNLSWHLLARGPVELVEP